MHRFASIQNPVSYSGLSLLAGGYWNATTFQSFRESQGLFAGVLPVVGGVFLGLWLCHRWSLIASRRAAALADKQLGLNRQRGSHTQAQIHALCGEARTCVSECYQWSTLSLPLSKLAIGVPSYCTMRLGPHDSIDDWSVLIILVSDLIPAQKRRS